MPTIAHLSDLHFGREDPAVVAALEGHLNASPPDLVVVSGDFTQRARPGQFARAAKFYYGLPEPRLAVPGNHDVPLYNLWARWRNPLANYRKHILETTRPVFDDGQLCVVGLNSARRFGRRMKGFWKDGILRADDVAHACSIFAQTTAPIRILVAHHPLQVAHEHYRGDVVRHGKAALYRLASAGCDALLYGHIHVPHALLGVEETLQTPRSMLCVMAGTSTSVRRRLNEPNSYNRVWFDGDRCTVEVYTWDGKSFNVFSTQHFTRDAAGWTQI